MKRALAILTAVTALATFPLHAEGDYKDYAIRQGGAWPTHWPKELDPLRSQRAPSGLASNTFWRVEVPKIHFGIQFTTREEFEAAWPHLLKVKSKGAPIVLRSGPSYWLGGASHGVCVHQQPAIWRISGRNLPVGTTPRDMKPLNAEELKGKTTSYLELFVDGTIVDLNRISLPKDTPIIDKRVKETDSGVKPDPEETPAAAVKDPDAETKTEEKIAWGKESKGLVANLRALTTTVKPGEPLEFEIRIKNVSEKETYVWGHKKPSPAAWMFYFGPWEWRPPIPSLPHTPLKPGDTASVRCLVATTRDSLSAEQKRRLVGKRWVPGVAPFRNADNKKESVRLPEGVYRVRATTRGFTGGDRDTFLNTNTIEVRIDDATKKPASRKLRDFALSSSFGDRYRTKDVVLSMYDHLWVEVTEPAKTEAIKKELAKYGRVVKGINDRVWGADVFDDVDTASARAALAKVDGVGETGTRKRGAYDKRIPDLKATLEIGKKTYAIDNAHDLDLAFVLTNISNREPREFLSVDSTMCQLDLKLEGPGAQSAQIVKTRESTLVKLGKVIRLEPGKSYKIPVSDLTYGHEYWVHQWKWTKPGDYTLTAAYVIGEVQYEAPPVKLEVVDK